MTKSRISDDQIREAAKKCEAGSTLEEAAVDIGITKQGLAYRFESMGIKTKEKPVKDKYYLLQFMADYEYKNDIFPGQEDISKDAGVYPNEQSTLIKELKKDSLIKKVGQRIGLTDEGRKMTGYKLEKVGKE